MAYPSSIPTQQSDATDRALDGPELIDRLAEQLRATSGNDLPHAYFVEQVRLGLAARDLADLTATNDIEGASRRRHSRANGSVFRAWAMPE